jgi:quinol monooxygenase YgiN
LKVVLHMEIRMPKITRRALMRNSSLAASATLAAGGLALASAQEDSTRNVFYVFHAFVFQWKPDATDAQKARAEKDIRAFQGAIPGLLETRVGPNVSPRGKGYTFGGIMRFSDQAALEAYVQHPSHQALLAWLVPLIDAIELDLRS